MECNCGMITWRDFDHTVRYSMYIEAPVSLLLECLLYILEDDQPYSVHVNTWVVTRPRCLELQWSCGNYSRNQALLASEKSAKNNGHLIKNHF